MTAVIGLAPQRARGTSTAALVEQFCALLPDQGPLGLVGGAGVIPVAHGLAGRAGLLIVTNVVDLTIALPAIGGPTVVLLPGSLSAARTTYGPLSGAALAGLNMDVVAVVADGWHPGYGVTLTDPDGVGAARAVIAAGRRTAVLVPAHAIGRRAPGGRCLGLDRVDLLVAPTALLDQPARPQRMRRDAS